MAQDRQQPGPGVGAVEAFHSAERADQRVLHEVLSVRGLARQGQCNPVQHRDLRQDVLVKRRTLAMVTGRFGHVQGTRLTR
jgi:hypothetical protein